eukprot:m.80359 g.80359  ORF g.80359 m.80359 type:complete len:542 (+) comp8204_c0_seq4:2-1627(+)
MPKATQRCCELRQARHPRQPRCVAFGMSREVSYVRVHPTHNPDFAGAVVDIIGQSTTPLARETSPTTLSGWGLKHGYQFCTWKRRYFRLDASTLRYYKGTKARSPKGVIQLSAYCLCKCVDVGSDRAANSLGYVKLVNKVPVTEKIVKEHGISILVPEQERTYYLHFSNDEERLMWFNAINRNIEVLRRAEGKIEEMISKVMPFADDNTIPREKAGIVKMSLRGRFGPIIDTSSSDPFVTAMTAIAMKDFAGLQSSFGDGSIIDRQTETGTTLLIKACTVGHSDICRFLLENGANPDLARKDGDTPLIVAARLNHHGIVRMLLEYGADRDAVNIYKETATSEGRHSDMHISKDLETYKPAIRKPGAAMTRLALERLSTMSVPNAKTMTTMTPQELAALVQQQAAALQEAQAALAQAQYQSAQSMPAHSLSAVQESTATGLDASAVAATIRRMSISRAARPEGQRLSKVPEGPSSDASDEDGDDGEDDFEHLTTASRAQLLLLPLVVAVVVVVAHFTLRAVVSEAARDGMLSMSPSKMNYAA